MTGLLSMPLLAKTLNIKMSNNSNSDKSLFFWLAILAAVAVALYLIVKLFFPQLIKTFASFLGGLLVVATGLVFRRIKK